MSEKKKSEIDSFDEANASVLAEMLVDLRTSEGTRLQIINELNEAHKTSDFFEAIFNEALSLAKCPNCDHETHWAIPDDKLAQFGWVGHQNDPRVKMHTTEQDCPQFQEACSKKRNLA